MPRFTIPRTAHCSTGGLPMPRYTIPRTAHCSGGALAMTRRNPSPQYRYEHYDPR